MKQHKIPNPPCEIHLFDSAEELTQRAARDWLEFLQVLQMAGQEPTVAISGGRIAETFFETANKVFASHRDALRKVHFFWADERCVPPEHPESNYGLAARKLLKPMAVPKANIHRIPGEIEPNLAAVTAARGIAKWTHPEEGQVPVLNLVLLGMGEDGHVASLFPGESGEVMEQPAPYRTVSAVKPPSRRVTVSYAILSKAQSVWVLISGKGKEAALRDSLAAPDRTPLGRVLASRSDTRIYTDLSDTDSSMP